MVHMNKFIYRLIYCLILGFFIFSPGEALANPNPLQDGFIDIKVGDESNGDTSTVKLLFFVALLSLSSSLFLMFTHFTYVVIVLSMTRQALGTMNIPPNQVLMGLALFISIYMMQPVIDNLYENVWKPWDEGAIETSEALEKAEPVIKKYMLDNTYDKDLEMMLQVRKDEKPDSYEEVSLFAAIPAFTLSQIQKGLITGMLIYWAFVFIDMVISALLMYMGMMMLPPMMLSLPFKVLIFVYIGGYTKIVEILFKSVNL